MPKKQLTQQNYSTGKVLLNWQFPEFIKYQRTVSWYIWTALIVIGLIIYSIFTANFFLIVIVLMVLLILFIHYKQEPLLVNFEIAEGGIVLANKFYPYKDIKNFWLIYEPPDTKFLYFDFVNAWRPRLIIPLDKQNPLQIRKILLKYLTEDLEQKNEPLSEALGRFLKL